MSSGSPYRSNEAISVLATGPFEDVITVDGRETPDDRQQKGIPDITLHVEILDVTIGAKNCHALERNRLCRFCGKELRHRSLDRTTPVLVREPRCLINHKPGGMKLRLHVGKLVLYRLIVRNCLAELASFMRICPCIVESRPRNPDANRRDLKFFDIEARTDNHRPAAIPTRLAADNVFKRDFYVIKRNVSRC